MNDYIYLVTPFCAWLICGITKFIINCIKEKRLAFDLIGYGGMPSNHSTIVVSMVSLIGFNEGITHPAFGVALTVAFIVIMDATSLRKTVEKHAISINQINKDHNEFEKLRERVGHSKLEVFIGIILGVLIGFLASSFQ